MRDEEGERQSRPFELRGKRIKRPPEAQTTRYEELHGKIKRQSIHLATSNTLVNLISKKIKKRANKSPVGVPLSASGLPNLSKQLRVVFKLYRVVRVRR